MEKVETEKVEPAPLQVALLYKILKAQRETLEFLKERTSEGVDFPIPEQTVTGVATINFLKEYPYRKVRSIDFFNKGPDTVYVRVNEEKEFSIEDKERVTSSKPKAEIEYVTLRVSAGEQAVLRLWGHY